MEATVQYLQLVSAELLLHLHQMLAAVQQEFESLLVPQHQNQLAAADAAPYQTLQTVLVFLEVAAAVGAVADQKDSVLALTGRLAVQVA